MIQQIKIKNFQSHKDTTLNLHSGINILTGRSNSGKSAAMRALLWLITNRPVGNSIISFWNRDDKDNPIDETSVTIQKDEKEIRRIKSPDRNGYDLPSTELNAINKDVPKEVEKLLNISDINIQNQFDQHFLLSSTAGEVAKFFNKTIKTDLIDSMLSAIESKKRSNKQDILSVEKAIKEFDEQIKKYTWLEQAEETVSQYEELKEMLKVINDEKQSISEILSEYNIWQTVINTMPDTKKFYEIIEQIASIKVELEKIENERNNINSEISNYNNSFDIYNRLQGFENVGESVQRIESVRKELEENEDKILELKAIIRGITENERTIMECTTEIEKLEKELPDVCPFCGEIKGGRR